ncbi:anti-sigma factor family protein [Paenibacillus sp. GCM10028914]|uniref:anti-sigma factor family protein n=1 Tax=Paenibacillus sp. GCM10028914 TaxID=3273416 RepID=UPI003619B468
MNCQEVVEYMHRYLDQDLDPEETAQMYRHVAVCPACAEKFSVLKSLSRDLEDLPAVTPPYSLVDAILPQLEAIDRARTEQTKEDAVIRPAVMVPELKRNGRRANWWGSIAGRTVMGSVAAAIILGVAIFHYEPEMLSDAEVPYNGASLPASRNSSGSQELPENDTLTSKSVVSEKGETENNGEERSITSEETEEPGKSKLDKSLSDEPVSTDAQPSSPVPTPPQQDKKDEPRTGGNTSSGEGTANNNAKDSVPPQQTQDQYVPPEQQVEPDSQRIADNHSDQLPADKDIPSTDNSEQEVGKTSLYGITGMIPQQWPSPDGLYSASVAIDKMVLFRLPSVADQLPEEVIALPLNGEWVNGEWSKDSKVFTYTLLVDQKEVKHEINVDQPIDPNVKVEPQDNNSNSGTDSSEPATNP